MIASRIKVTGKVQGVFFRASTKEKADELGVKGWVRNESDGSVLIEVEGEEKALNEFEKWCSEGPPLARVTYVEKQQIAIQGFESFIITH